MSHPAYRPPPPHPARAGHLFTKGPGFYKIPTANDIPLDFRVELLQNAPNPRAIHSSKVGGRAGGLAFLFSKCIPLHAASWPMLS
jgi:xanthine dehydrogenase molybdopterin-binding subunit B